MADVTLGMELSKRLDERYAQVQERRVSERQVTERVAAQQAEGAQRDQQIQQNQAEQAAEGMRRLDAEERLRDQKLALELDQMEQKRLVANQAAIQQAAFEQVARAAENPNRGAIVDLVA